MYCRIATIAVVALGLSFTAQAQSKIAPVAKLPTKPAATRTEDAQLFRNTTFGFRYKVPYGWVDRTKEMREGDEAGKAELLGAFFERPPEAAGGTVNSAVVIAAESAASYPGLNDAAQYFGPLGEVTTAKGLTAVNEPYEFPVDAKPIVRCDFVKKLGAVTMHQSTLALLSKGYVVSFTFIGGSDDEVTMLIENLAFGKVKTPVHK